MGVKLNDCQSKGLMLILLKSILRKISGRSSLKMYKKVDRPLTFFEL
jgi:hypothetical protein